MSSAARWVPRVVALVAALVGLVQMVVVLDPDARPHRGGGAVQHPAGGLAAAVASGHYLLLGSGLLLLLVVPAVLRASRAAWVGVLAGLLLSAAGSTTLRRPLLVLAALAAVAGVLLTRRWFTARADLARTRLGLGVLVGGLGLVGAFGALGLYTLDGQFRGGTTLPGSITDAVRLLFMLPISAEPVTRHARWVVTSTRWAALVVVLAALVLLVAAASAPRQRPEDRAVVSALLDRWASTALAQFHLLPDKRWMIASDGQAFVGYGLSGRTAVSLGGPVGAPGAVARAAGEFLDLCRRNGWTPGFHQVTEGELAELAPLGLCATKIGEEAIVPSSSAALEGSGLKSVRSAVRRCERAGLRVIQLPHPLTDADGERLREVSDLWAADGNHRERTFTVGQFDIGQLRAAPVLAVVDDEQRIQAFANLLPRRRGAELTFDLMRRRPGSINGVMDQLFAALLLRARDEGATGLNLGLAPFTGLQDERGTAARVMRVLYDRGGMVFGYAGIRAYKDKWGPRWEPRYLVSRRETELPRVAVGVARLGELPDGHRPLVRAGMLLRRFPLTAAFVGVQLWLMLATAWAPEVHEDLVEAAGSSWELLVHGQVWRLVTSPIVQASPGLVWFNLLLGTVVFLVVEARWGSRRAGLLFFVGDLVGSVPVLLATRLMAAAGSSSAVAHLTTLDNGTSSGTWALVAAIAWMLPPGRRRTSAVAALLLGLSITLWLGQELFDVQHLASALGTLLLLAARERWPSRRSRDPGTGGEAAAAAPPVQTAGGRPTSG